MKHLVPVLLLLTTPQLTWAQTHKPVCAVVQDDKSPQASDVIDHLFDAYEGAKTFRGEFELTAYSRENAKAKSKLSFGFKLQTLVRFNDNGDLSGEVSRLEYRNSDPQQNVTLRLVDDGKTAHNVYEEQKAWEIDQHANTPVLRKIIQPVLEEIVRGLKDQVDWAPKLSKGKDAGRDVFIVQGDLDDGKFRAIVDQQTRALRLLEFSTGLNSLTMRGTNQTFNAPANDNEFAWNPDPAWRQVQPGEIKLPPALQGAQDENLDAAPSPVPVPAVNQ